MSCLLNKDDSEVLRSARHLLSLLSNQRQRADGPSTSQDSNRQRFQPHGQSSLRTEMTRSFPGLFSNRRGKRRFTETCPVPKKQKPFQVMFHLLPTQCERSPSGPDQLLHAQAGLGRRTATLDENMTHQELCDTLTELYPKLGGVTGGWLLYKAAGGWGIRKLTIVAPADCGYTGRLVKATKVGENSVLYIAPLQDELDTTPSPPSSESFRNMPKAVCKKCNILYPLQVLTNHIKSCPDVVTLDDDDEEKQDEAQDEEREYSDINEVMKNERAVCPICQERMPHDILEVHASECGERTIDNTMNDTTELTFMDNEMNHSTQVTYMNDGN
ncbi:uncharacterized protein LOC130428228 [Triplophysa dalaica]|uniref:uncharacterized protein LOC130428228 n=1 Tax=Triplophysa dalaica TaxID=1582913 RepID=UPI0024E00B3A|nr:uncharacterized protein LOC130428228 [Triplophysa dalaica]